MKLCAKIASTILIAVFAVAGGLSVVSAKAAELSARAAPASLVAVPSAAAAPLGAAALSPAPSADDLDLNIYGYIAEGLLSGLIITLGVYVGKERGSRLDARQEKITSLQSALEDFKKAYNRIVYRTAGDPPIDPAVIDDLYAAKGRVDAAAVFLPDIPEAKAATAITAEDMEKIQQSRMK